MLSVRSQIEIASPPERVREIVLDFPRYPEWSKSLVTSIKPVSPKDTIEAGDKLKAVAGGMPMTPVVNENSPRQLVWTGSIPYVVYGKHFFRFDPSTKTPGHTTFVHGEDFTGPLASVCALFMQREQVSPGFEKYNQELKTRAEGLYGSK